MNKQEDLIKKLTESLTNRIKNLENIIHLTKVNKSQKKYDKRVRPANYTKECVICNKIFKAAVNKAKFCSTPCSNKYYYKKSLKKKAKEKLDKEKEAKEKLVKKKIEETKKNENANDSVSNIKNMINNGTLKQHIKSR